MKFKEQLEDLKNNVGGRNGLLMGIVLTGFNEGLKPKDVAAAFASTDCGEPPLTDAEISRAINRAAEYFTGEPNKGARFEVAMKRARANLEAASPDERGFVRRMIAMCPNDGIRPSKRLVESSPVKIRSKAPTTDPDFARAMGVAYVKARFPDDSVRIFATDNIKGERERTRIYKPSQLAAFCRDNYIPVETTYDRCCEIVDGGGCVTPRPRDGSETERIRAHNMLATTNDVYHFQPLTFYPPEISMIRHHRGLPSHIGVNPVTGAATKKKGGGESYANKETVATFGQMLVEFDMLDLADQARFWYGVVTSRALDVLTITYTCNKSLHGIVRVNEMAQGDDLFGGVSREAAEQQWKREFLKMSRICGSDEDVRYRADLSAMKDCARLTRFPGGRRDHLLPQLLVWCAKPDNGGAKIKWF